LGTHNKKINGYVLVKAPSHPKSLRGGWYWEHIIVVEESLGRNLADYESVHHINEIKHDNRIENLFVCHRQEHDKAHGMKTVSFYRMHETWVGKQCEACGKVFFGSPSVMKKRKRCNSMCKKKNTIEKVCHFCYNKYTIPASADKHYKYCSKVCRLRAKAA
jgi:hypothetical protein